MQGNNLFFDTNVLLYLLSDDELKSNQAEAALAQGGVVSVQVLNEFTAIARRKQRLNYAEIRDALDVVRSICRIMPLNIKTHELALTMSERYGFFIYDSLIIATALQADCKWLYSEDMQHGQLIENQLHIHNPFKLTEIQPM